jgi:glycosyltransferase involved in cell wall biosynthesis
MVEISVIIPLYNKGPYIARAINSVLKQTYQDFEVIIVDGGSTDDGVEIAKELCDSRFHIIIQEDKGVSAARNLGVKVAQADFITFLDADDEWMPVHLETIMRLRKEYPEAGLYATAWKTITPDGKIRWADYRHIPDPSWEGVLPNYFVSSALGEPPVWTSVAGIPKRIFVEVGGFPSGYWWGEDADLFGKIALKYPVAFSWVMGAIYYTDALNRLTNNKHPLDNEEPFVKTARAALERGDVLPEHIGPLNEYIAKKEIPRAIGKVLTGDSKTARSILRQCRTRYLCFKKMKWLILATLPYPILLFLQKQKHKILRQNSHTI